MNTVLFFSYWSMGEPLTRSTVTPTLQMLLREGLADRVVLVTMERGPDPKTPPSSITGVEHVPLRAARFWPRPLARGFDLMSTAPKLAGLARRHGASIIIARGVVAGGFAHFAARRSGRPYAVDYFEPHADYMAEVGEWSSHGPLYKGLRHLMALQLRSARALVAVSNNYRERLIAQGADAGRLFTAPCPADDRGMRFNATDRRMVRNELGWSDAIVGVYAGKFGGLYHREASYAAFARAARRVGPDYAQIILTTEPRESVMSGLRSAGFDTRRAEVRFAPHDEVARWLSASDIAFAPYVATPSSACLSPMKIGEYWANGLPVLLTRGVGDDSAIIEREAFAGGLFDPLGNDLDAALDRLLALLSAPGQRAATALLAQKYRGIDRTLEAYRRVLGGR